MTRSELIEKVEFGADIMFDCAQKHYTILGWNDEGPLIAEQGTEANKAVFKNAQTLIAEYIIDGKTPEERIDEIEITFCT